MLQLKLTAELLVRITLPLPLNTCLTSQTDVNRKDYRAWYGLGQAYELLSMHHYSLYYYQRATALR
jgi:hypothetical protein